VSDHKHALKACRRSCCRLNGPAPRCGHFLWSAVSLSPRGSANQDLCLRLSSSTERLVNESGEHGLVCSEHVTAGVGCLSRVMHHAKYGRKGPWPVSLPTGPRCSNSPFAHNQYFDWMLRQRAERSALKKAQYNKNQQLLFASPTS
jgi:hypothetical protein